jgi:CrcB protein
LANAFAAAILALVYFTDKTDKFEFSPGFFIFITVGYCGGLSTFSTFSLECFQWMVTGMWLKLISYVLIQLVTSLGLIYLVGKFIQ